MHALICRCTIALLAAALCTALPLPGTSQAPLHVRVLTTTSESGAEVYYAFDLGFFRDAGLDVELASLGNGAPVAAAIASGTIDIGQGNVVSVAAGRQRGLPFVIIAPASMYANTAPTSALIVPANSPVKTAHDLVGKIIGNTGTKDIGEIAADGWLDQNGVPPSGVKFIEIPLAEMQEAMRRDRIQAAVSIEPFLDAALANGFRVLGHAYSSIGNSFVIGAYFAGADWVKSHPAIAKKFSEAIFRAGRWANDPAHYAESARIIEKYTKVQIPTGATRVHYAESLNPALIQLTIDAAARYNAMPAPLAVRQMLP